MGENNIDNNIKIIINNKQKQKKIAKQQINSSKKFKSCQTTNEKKRVENLSDLCAYTFDLDSVIIIII